MDTSRYPRDFWNEISHFSTKRAWTLPSPKPSSPNPQLRFRLLPPSTLSILFHFPPLHFSWLSQVPHSSFSSPLSTLLPYSPFYTASLFLFFLQPSLKNCPNQSLIILEFEDSHRPWGRLARLSMIWLPPFTDLFNQNNTSWESLFLWVAKHASVSNGITAY